MVAQGLAYRPDVPEMQYVHWKVPPTVNVLVNFDYRRGPVMKGEVWPMVDGSLIAQVRMTDLSLNYPWDRFFSLVPYFTVGYRLFGRDAELTHLSLTEQDPGHGKADWMLFEAHDGQAEDDGHDWD